VDIMDVLNDLKGEKAQATVTHVPDRDDPEKMRIEARFTPIGF
jgi:hypothetical protein